jgi:hypothetical protein
MEQFHNFALSTLNGAINSSQTTLVVTSGSTFPTTGTFSVIVDSEIMKVTGVSGTTFTVVRGQEGSTAASHSSGANVYGVLTERALQQYRKDNFDYGTMSSMSVAQKAGRILFTSDTIYHMIDRGSDLTYKGPLYKLTPPLISDYTWVNQGSATADATMGGIYLNAPINGSLNVRMLAKAAPATPYTIMICAVPMLFPGGDFGACGLIFRDSSGGRVMTMEWLQATGPKVCTERWTSVTVQGTDPAVFADQNQMIEDPDWLVIQNDGTNLRCGFSLDGSNIMWIREEAKTSWFTGNPDQIGLFCNSYSASYGAAMHVLSWTGG